MLVRSLEFFRVKALGFGFRNCHMKVLVHFTFIRVFW